MQNIKGYHLEIMTTFILSVVSSLELLEKII